MLDANFDLAMAKPIEPSLFKVQLKDPYKDLQAESGNVSIASVQETRQAPARPYTQQRGIP